MKLAKLFKKDEWISLALTLSVILGLMIYNYQIALRKARDAQRKADLGYLSEVLDKYRTDFGLFPQSSDDGKIIACGDFSDDEISKFKELYQNKQPIPEELSLKPCEWGEDPLADPYDPDYEPYAQRIPQDPKTDEGRQYLYLSTGRYFQIYAALEGENEDANQKKIAERGLECGEFTCDYGKSFKDAPLDISLQEYENELRKGSVQ